jgi:peptidoglycan/xylan/chitin deacetylase (PgdA/CDA1 family)/SAM-dependent methyltransferase
VSRGVAVVVRCGDQPQQLYATVHSALRQSSPPSELVVVTDSGTPASALAWISSFVAQQGGRPVRAESAAAGAVKNAGLAVAETELAVCLDAGERVDPRYLELAAARFEGAGELALVTSALRRTAADGATIVHSAGGCSLADLAADLALVHSASMFRLRDWRDAGGFDGSLGALDEVDLWFRLLARGRGELLALPLVERRGGSRSLERRAWERESRRHAIDLLVDRYPEPFRAAIGVVVERQEKRLQAAQRLFRERTRRRERGLAEAGELDSLARQLEEVAGASASAGRRPDLLSRTSPVLRDWGYERGGPVDRVLIERFLQRHSEDVRGVVLEVQENDYTIRFGGDRVIRSEVIDLDAGNPRATVIADLRDAANLACGSFDCILLTQTVHVIDDMRAVVAEAYRLLTPGGTLLVTLPSASRVCLEYGPDGDFWRVTPAGARALFAGIVPPEQIEIGFEGSVVTKAAFLYGLGAPELDTAAAAAADPYFPALVTVRARKPKLENSASLRRPLIGAAPFAPRTARPGDPPRGAILLYHRVGWPPSDVHRLTVPPEQFRMQLAALRESCRPMSLHDLSAAVAGGHLPPRAVAVTFDDGYADNLEIALPLLAEFEIPATFFVTTAGLEARRHFWWDVLEQILLQAPHLPPRLEIEVAGRPFDAVTSGFAARRRAHDVLHAALVRTGAAEREAALARIIEWSGGAPALAAGDARLSASEIVELARQPRVEIGAHTANHLLLPEQPEEVQRREMLASVESLSALIGRTISSLAYPYGGVAPATVAIVRDSGIARAVTCETSHIVAGLDLLALPRFDVGGRSRKSFEAVLQSLVGEG